MATIKHKRSTTPNGEPTTLEQGEVAFNIADDPVKAWIGTPSGVKQLFSEAVEDAEDDAVYGRCNGDWVPVPIVSPTEPVDPAPNSLWFDSVNGKLYLWFDEKQWIGVTDGATVGGGGGGAAGPSVIVSHIAPTGVAQGQLWWDCSEEGGALYIRFNNQWVAASPTGGGGGAGGAQVIVAPSAPPNPAPNTLWFNSTDGQLYLWFNDGTSSQWLGLTDGGSGGGGTQVIISATAPTGVDQGQLWWDSVGGQLYVFDADNQWVITVNPALLSGNDAPSDGIIYGRQSGKWASVNSVIEQFFITGGNLVDNSGFSINQRLAAPNVSLADNQYFLDRWKAAQANTTCNYELEGATGNNKIITVTSGSIQQIISGSSITGSQYVLSWTGTAQGRVGTSDPFAPSPVVANVTPKQNLAIQFNVGTLGEIKMELGSTPTPWFPIAGATELVNCQRYFQTHGYAWAGHASTGATIMYNLWLPVWMRTTPTISSAENQNTGLAARSVTPTGGSTISWTAQAAGGFIWSGWLNISADL